MAPILGVRAHPLHPAWTKWKRASPALKRVDRAIVKWRKQHLGKFSTKTDHATGEDVVYARMSGTPGPTWPFAIGEVIYGYRCALDYLYFVLVIHKHGDPPPAQIEKAAQFPIIHKPGWKFDRSKARQFVDSPVVDWLEQIQPDKGPKYEPLRDLAVLSNFDKHRRLVLVAGGIIDSDVTVKIIRGCRLVRPPTPFRGPVVDRQEISRFMVEPTGPNHAYVVNGRFASDVVFGQNTPLAGKPVIRTLHDIRVLVGELLLEAEKMFLPPWKPPRWVVVRRRRSP